MTCGFMQSEFGNAMNKGEIARLLKLDYWEIFRMLAICVAWRGRMFYKAHREGLGATYQLAI